MDMILFVIIIFTLAAQTVLYSGSTCNVNSDFLNYILSIFFQHTVISTFPTMLLIFNFFFTVWLPKKQKRKMKVV
jgi:uncharacterized BrkB/YihY/UPF0761 family membrane protein